jgi:cold shock protein
MAQERIKGTVKQYDSQKGFGFIGRSGGKDVFVSQSEVARAGLSSLSKGDQLTFTLRETAKGYQAENLEVSSPFRGDYLKNGYFYSKPGDG